MYVIKQDDYEQFKCIAGKCPKSCCIGWQIVIDEESLDKYRNLDSEFGEKLRHGIDFKEGIFNQSNGRCSMLNAENLCDLQMAEGEDMLCYTCQMFPRHIEEYEDVREYSLSLSCPEAARMVVERAEKIGFVEFETDEVDDFEEFDYLLYSKLVDSRDIIYKIVQNRSFSLDKRMALILEFAGKMQKLLDENRLYEMDDLIQEWDSIDEFSEINDINYEPYDISVLFELERLDNEWTDILADGYEFIKNKDVNQLIRELTSMEMEAAERVLTLLIYTYYCGAVYDDWIYSKMALCVYSTQWIISLYKSQLAENEINGNVLLIKTIYSYAREVEHSDINLNMLEELFA